MEVLGPLTWKLDTGYNIMSASPWPHLVVVTLVQAMLQYPSSCLMQAV